VVGGIATVAEAIAADMRGRLPGQHKKQRAGLALLTATMPDVRGANLMDLAASLPRPAERLDMRYQWISRRLGNGLIDADAVVAPYGRELLARLAAEGRTVVLTIDHTRATGRHQLVVVAARVGGRASPPAWRVKATTGAIGFVEQREALEAVARLLPEGTRPVLTGDRFGACPGPDPGAAPSCSPGAGARAGAGGCGSSRTCWCSRRAARPRSRRASPRARAC
jgi:hypothetical protein